VLQANRSVKSKKTFLQRFKERFGHLPIRTLELQHADKYIGWRKTAGVKNSTINRELACLRHMVEWAVDRGYVDRNPFRRLEMLEEQEYAPLRSTDEIIEAVFAELEPHVCPVFVLIRETGARRGEVLRLEHWQVDRENREILFAKRTKSGKNRLVPITDRAVEALDVVPPLPGCPYVFYDPETGTRWQTLRSQWLRARERAGYPWLTPKHLRPAFATELSERGLETHMVQDLLGHSSVAVTERFYLKRRQRAACRAALRVLAGRKAG
jgi:site-specific recombinase XerD